MVSRQASVKLKHSMSSELSKQLNEAEMLLEKRNTKQQQQSVRKNSWNHSNSVKILVERMEALDLEEEEFIEQSQSEEDDKWSEYYRNSLKRYLTELAQNSR